MARVKKEKKVKDRTGKVGFGRLVLWQSSSVSVALNTLLLGYVTVYCTDTLKLSAAIVGTVFMLSKLVDGVTDLLCGFIIDRTNTRWGKGRPYEIFMLFLWLATWGLFSVPESFSTIMKYIWLFIMYVLVNAVCKTFLNGNNVVYLVRAFRTREEQVRVTAYGSFFTMAGAVIFNVLFPTAMAKIGTSPAGWSRLVGMIAVPLTAFGLLRILFIPERYNNEADTKSGSQLKLRDIAELFRQNRYFVIFVLISLITNIVSNMGVNVYYWKYIVGNVALMGVTSIFSILGLPLAFLMPRWSRKYGLKKMCVTGYIISMLSYFCIFMAGGHIIPLVILMMICNFGVVPAIFYLVIVLLFRAYKLDDYRDEIKADLAIRRGETTGDVENRDVQEFGEVTAEIANAEESSGESGIEAAADAAIEKKAEESSGHSAG